MATLRRVRKTVTVTQRTYRTLERAIAQRRLAPGQPLVIADLAQELGVSRTPVREALLMLQKAGLVEVGNGRMTVAGLSSVDLDEVFEVREAIELFCVRKAAESVDRVRVQELRALITPHLEANPMDAAEAAAADLRFHRALVAAADNQRLLGAWDHAGTHLERFWHDGRANRSRVRSDIAECAAVIDAIEEGDGDAAAAALRHHLHQTKAALAAWESGAKDTST